MRQAGDQPCFYRVGNIYHDDGDCFGSILGSSGSWSASGNDDVYLELYQLVCKIRNSFIYSLSITVFNGNVLSLDVAQVTEPLAERLVVGQARGR